MAAQNCIGREADACARNQPEVAKVDCPIGKVPQTTTVIHHYHAHNCFCLLIRLLSIALEGRLGLEARTSEVWRVLRMHGQKTGSKDKCLGIVRRV